MEIISFDRLHVWEWIILFAESIHSVLYTVHHQSARNYSNRIVEMLTWLLEDVFTANSDVCTEGHTRFIVKINKIL